MVVFRGILGVCSLFLKHLFSSCCVLGSILSFFHGLIQGSSNYNAFGLWGLFFVVLDLQMIFILKKIFKKII